MAAHFTNYSCSSDISPEDEIKKLKVKSTYFIAESTSDQYSVLLLKFVIVHNALINVFPQKVVGRWRGYSGDLTAKTVTALGNLTDDFGTEVGP